MTHFDVFNGDADGLCALQQLRLAAPRDAVLVTGVKRDIALLQRVPAGPGDSVTALDISLDANRAALMELLGRGVTVEYFDHHYPGDVPVQFADAITNPGHVDGKDGHVELAVCLRQMDTAQMVKLFARKIQ